MFFLSRAQLKIEEYQKTLQMAYFVSSSKTNKTFKCTKQKKLLDQLVEITTTFLDCVSPEDLIYIAIFIYEQIFCQRQKSEISCNSFQGSSNIVNGNDNDAITDSDPIQMNEETRNNFDIIQQFLLISFSLILKEKNKKKEEFYEKEWLISNQGVFEILKECFAYYYPLYMRRNISPNTHLMNLSKNFDHDVKIKQTSELIMEVDKHQMKNLNTLGRILLDILLHSERNQIKNDIEHETFSQALTECIFLCKRTQFWSGYFHVLTKGPMELLWKELDFIFMFKNSTLLGHLGFLSSKDDCLQVLDQIQRKRVSGK